MLDPACGSGTFLFHAVRHYLATATAAGVSEADAMTGATAHIFGIDVHPVAITLARPTYLLAIGRERLRTPGRPNIHVPVYLGDSVQWRSPQINLWSQNGLTIEIDDSLELWASRLEFPARLLDDAGRFDRLVEELASRAANREAGSTPPSLAATFSRFAVHPDDQPTLESTFKTMCRLNDEDRNHVWSLMRLPPWLSSSYALVMTESRRRTYGTEGLVTRTRADCPSRRSFHSPATPFWCRQRRLCRHRNDNKTQAHGLAAKLRRVGPSGGWHVDSLLGDVRLQSSGVHESGSIPSRLIHSTAVLPPMNSNEMVRWCEGYCEALWDEAQSITLFERAAETVRVVAAGDLHRDNIRTEPFTEALKTQIRD